MTNSFNVRVDHNFAKIDDAIGFFPRVWRTAKKCSVSNTLTLASVNAWLQFSLAYVAAVIITSNNLSFITDIFNPTFMPIYTFVSIILLTTLVSSTAIKHMHKHRVKEAEKSIEELIDNRIRGGKGNEISEIAENAMKVEIIPDLSFICHKKANLSIVLPISESQKKTLNDQKQENKNRVIFLTTPYIISATVIIGALIQNRFSLINIQQGLEWTMVTLASIFAITGICMAYSMLKNNEINNNFNLIKKFNNLDILIPFRWGGIVSIMQKKTRDEIENDPMSRLIELLDRHLIDFTDKIVSLLNKHLNEAEGLIDNSLLKPVNCEIKETLVLLREIRKDLKRDLDKLYSEISLILSQTKGLTERASSLNIESIFSSLENTIKVAEDKVKRFEPSRFIGFFRAREETTTSSNELFCLLKEQKEKAEMDKVELKKQLKKLTSQLEGLKNKQALQGEFSLSNNKSTILLEEEGDEEKKAKERNRFLKLKKRLKKLENENLELEKELSEKEKAEEWKKKINGKASEFLFYLLDFIKLKTNAESEEPSEMTLRHFDNNVIIHWKDGSQTVCDIKKQDFRYSSAKVYFVDQDIDAAFKVACAW